MINFTFNWLNYTPKGAHFKNDLEYLGDDGVECDLKNTVFEDIYLEVTSKGCLPNPNFSKIQDFDWIGGGRGLTHDWISL